ncbi:MAG: cytochrome o ubiquinol oxidase subunit IV [Candidatus Saccharimonadales bacterium]
MSKPENMTTEKGTLASYVTGFIFSVYLTVTAYLAVYNHAFSTFRLTAFIIVLAVVQFVVQMVFFLHIGKERKPRWKFVVMLFMIVVLLILVLGSLWIMSNLNYRMTPEQMNNYMRNQQGL